MKEDVHITLIQSDLHWENPPANLKMFSEKIELIHEPVDLILLPEMFSTGFSMSPEKFAETMEGNAINWMKETAQKKKCVICGSLMIKSTAPSEMTGRNPFFNRLIWMRADGSFEIYDKRHLFGLGEEQNHYSAGYQKLLVELKGWKILPLVCYDLRFPVWSRNRFIRTLKENETSSILNNEDEKNLYGGDAYYDILIYVASWPERRIHAWKTLLEARAIENQCYVLGVNRVGTDGNDFYYPGESAVVDPRGEIIWRADNTECVHSCTLSFYHLNHIRGSLPFLKDADDFEFKV
ncbi:MAG: nitrilase family protein [Chitinophagales bacterium]